MHLYKDGVLQDEWSQELAWASNRKLSMSDAVDNLPALCEHYGADRVSDAQARGSARVLLWLFTSVHLQSLHSCCECFCSCAKLMSTRSCVCKVCIHAVSHCESVSMSCEIVSRRLHVKQWHGRAQDLLDRRESREQPFLAALNVSELENLQEYRKRFLGHAVQLNQSAKGQHR